MSRRAFLLRVDELKKRACRPGHDDGRHQGLGHAESSTPSRTSRSQLLLGAFLTVLVVFVFLNFLAIDGHHRRRPADFPSWPASSPSGRWGFRLETMSLLGLSLAIGILIDDAIVVRENIVRTRSRWGKDPTTPPRAKAPRKSGSPLRRRRPFSILCVFRPDRLHDRHQRTVVQAISR